MENTPTHSSSQFLSPTKKGIPLPQLDDSPSHSPYRSPVNSPNWNEGELTIPVIPSSGIPIPKITGDTLCDIIDGKYDILFQELYIVDCRYDYEYDGGHIKNACNINSPEVLSEAFFEQPFEDALIVFHCEFSQNRGPQMAQIFREFDRDLNKSRYPALYYPQVYVLNGGYRDFFAKHPEYCDGGYVKMRADDHILNGDLVKATTDFRKGVDWMFNQRKPVQPDDQPKGFQSPMPYTRSPMATRMLNFLSSPRSDI